MQIIFMGTAPGIRPGQMNTSIFVRLGNGDSFIFDIGEGAVANYVKVTEDRRLDTWYLLLDTDYRSCTIH
jgi:ribonuclease BN (tRNA processing enzyme)